MAKKSHKPNLPQETLERARRELARGGELPAQPAQPAQPANGTGGAVVKAKPVARPVVHKADLAQEYAYVISDLQQMAMLAAGILVVLVILSFVI